MRAPLKVPGNMKIEETLPEEMTKVTAMTTPTMTLKTTTTTTTTTTTKTSNSSSHQARNFSLSTLLFFLTLEMKICGEWQRNHVLVLRAIAAGESGFNIM